MLTLLALLLSLVAALPDHAKTPGVTRPLSRHAICTTKWGKDARAVTEAMKRQVAEAYGLPRTAVVGYGRGPCCEFDHLISRELGGADDVRNLWPQPWAEAKQKDRLENKLHALVCSGALPLAQAQHEIATNWQTAYHRYLGTR